MKEKSCHYSNPYYSANTRNFQGILEIFKPTHFTGNDLTPRRGEMTCLKVTQESQKRKKSLFFFFSPKQAGVFHVNQQESRSSDHEEMRNKTYVTHRFKELVNLLPPKSKPSLNIWTYIHQDAYPSNIRILENSTYKYINCIMMMK